MSGAREAETPLLMTMSVRRSSCHLIRSWTCSTQPRPPWVCSTAWVMLSPVITQVIGDLQRPGLRAKDPGSRAGMHAQPRVERQAVPPPPPGVALDRSQRAALLPRRADGGCQGRQIVTARHCGYGGHDQSAQAAALVAGGDLCGQGRWRRGTVRFADGLQAEASIPAGRVSRVPSQWNRACTCASYNRCGTAAPAFPRNTKKRPALLAGLAPDDVHSYKIPVRVGVRPR